MTSAFVEGKELLCPSVTTQIAHHTSGMVCGKICGKQHYVTTTCWWKTAPSCAQGNADNQTRVMLCF